MIDIRLTYRSNRTAIAGGEEEEVVVVVVVVVTAVGVESTVHTSYIHTYIT